MFSHLYAPYRAVPPRTSIAEADAASQLTAAEAAKRRIEAQLIEQPFELDAVDGEFNPWHHAPTPMVDPVPDRWEENIYSSRVFFEAEPEMMSGRRRPPSGDISLSSELSSRKRKLGSLIDTAGLTKYVHTQYLPCASFSNVHEDQGIRSFEFLDRPQRIHEFTYS
ncbi:hypothetical protein BKA63DRAFT_510987 [Paraphoma chrysanthemicola]|nr:hypothetical protein BKA63DRAFT_510987 [Paraphoma chrysanthemicola]